MLESFKAIYEALHSATVDVALALLILSSIASIWFVVKYVRFRSLALFVATTCLIIAPMVVSLTSMASPRLAYSLGDILGSKEQYLLAYPPSILVATLFIAVSSLEMKFGRLRRKASLWLASIGIPVMIASIVAIGQFSLAIYWVSQISIVLALSIVFVTYSRSSHFTLELRLAVPEVTQLIREEAVHGVNRSYEVNQNSTWVQELSRIVSGEKFDKTDLTELDRIMATAFRSVANWKRNDVSFRKTLMMIKTIYGANGPLTSEKLVSLMAILLKGSDITDDASLTTEFLKYYSEYVLLRKSRYSKQIIGIWDRASQFKNARLRAVTLGKISNINSDDRADLGLQSEFLRLTSKTKGKHPVIGADLLPQFLTEAIGYQLETEDEFGIRSAGLPNEKRGETLFHFLHLIRYDESVRRSILSSLLSNSNRGKFICQSIEKFVQGSKRLKEEELSDLKQIVSTMKQIGISDAASKIYLTKIEKLLDSVEEGEQGVINSHEDHLL